MSGFSIPNTEDSCKLLLALGERCEARIGRDRDLDDAIFCAFGLAPVENGIAKLYSPPPYTLSVDWCITLLGKGWVWRRLTANSMSVYRTCPSKKAAMRFNGVNDTPARALAAAILYAKANSIEIAVATSRGKGG